MKTLVVWYSRKGYVRDIALKKVKEEDADMLELETTENTLGYNGFGKCVKSAVKKAKTVLFPYDNDIGAYDKVIICTPIWCSTMCTPVREFITKERHNICKAEYVFLHCMPKTYGAVADEMDKILRIKREKFTDIQCFAGHYIKEQEVVS